MQVRQQMAILAHRTKGPGSLVPKETEIKYEGPFAHLAMDIVRRLCEGAESKARASNGAIS
ncbi:hypothetical protein D3C84_1132470 [compost metagenome]